MTVLRLKLTVGQIVFEAEGDPELVRGLYEDFRDATVESWRTAQPPPASGLDGGNKASRPPPQMNEHASEVAQKASGLPLAAFIKGFKPRTNREKATLIALWAKYHEDSDSIATGEVERHWKKSTSWTAPGNLGRDLAEAVSHGLLTKEGHGAYAPTGYGESELDGRRLDG